MEEQICSLRLERGREKKRERGRLLHTPTFTASLWAAGLETVFLFFTHHCLFFFSLLDAPSKAVRRGRVSAGVDGMERVEKKESEREMLICEVTLLAWPPSKILSVAMKSEASGRARAREAFKDCCCGGGREGGDEGSQNARRRSASSPKSALITAEGEAANYAGWKRRGPSRCCGGGGGGGQLSRGLRLTSRG